MTRLFHRLFPASAALLIGVASLTAATAGDDQPTRRPAGETRIYILDGKNAELLAFDPRTGQHEVVALGRIQHQRVSPDGKSLVFMGNGEISVASLTRPEPPRAILKLEASPLGTPGIWSKDGTRLLLGRGNANPQDNSWIFQNFSVNADGTNLHELKIPPKYGIWGWSPDGKWLLTVSSRNAKQERQLHIMRTDGTEAKPITEDGDPRYARMSPDGTHVVYWDGSTEEQRGVWVIELKTLERRKILATGTGHSPPCWSPDGTRIAIVHYDLALEAEKFGEGQRLIMVDPDGYNRVEIPLGGIQPSGMPDWR